jgi:hypothetical protein
MALRRRGRRVPLLVRSRPARTPELMEEVADVRFHGFLAEEQRGGDFRVGSAVYHESCHLQLAPGKRMRHAAAVRCPSGSAVLAS